MLTARDRRILEAANFASVATTMPDGSPHVSTIWIDVDGDDVLFNTSEGRRKLSNLRRDPRVAISVFDQHDPYEQVVIRGSVVDVTTDGSDSTSIASRRSTWVSRGTRGWRSASSG